MLQWADWLGTAPINAQEQHLKILELLSYSSIRNHPLRKFLNKAFLSAKTLDPKKYFNKWRLQRSIFFPHKSWLSWNYFFKSSMIFVPIWDTARIKYQSSMNSFIFLDSIFCRGLNFIHFYQQRLELTWWWISLIAALGGWVTK